MRKDFKISGFKVPEKYFENFEDHLFGRIEEEKFPKSSGFNVPNGYFDNLEMRVLSKEKESKKQGKTIPIYPRKYLGYAAAIAACLVIGIMVINFLDNESSLDNIQLGLIDNYIDEGNLNMDLYELTTYFESRDIRINLENQHLSETNLEEYLLENSSGDVLFDE